MTFEARTSLQGVARMTLGSDATTIERQARSDGMPANNPIEAAVVDVLRDMVSEWDLDREIDSQSKLVGDLKFESIDIIQLVVALEEKFQRRNLGFSELLMTDGRYVDDLSVNEIVAFLKRKL
jgi:acyl carrier protein